MFCKNCGSELKDGAKFCANCGANIIENNIHTKPAENIVDKSNENNTSINGFIKKYAQKISLALLFSIIGYCIIPAWVSSYSIPVESPDYSSSFDYIFSAICEMMAQFPYLLCIIITAVLFYSTFKITKTICKINLTAKTFELIILSFIIYVFTDKLVITLLRAVAYAVMGVTPPNIYLISLIFEALLAILVCIISYRKAYRFACTIDFE